MLKTTSKCSCGSCELEIDGNIIDVCICHCNICRAYTRQPFNAVVVLTAGAISVTAGQECIASYATSPEVSRCHCTKCGSSLYEKPPGLPMEFTSLGAVLGNGTTDIPDDLAPRKHMFYADRVIDVNDHLPKYAEFDHDYSKIPHEPLPALSEAELKATARRVKL